jgi:cytochrome c-type biogenesis protein CcmF
MQEIQYIGEQLLYKQLGHLAIILGFVASVLATIAYFFATQNRETPAFPTWRKIGRTSFIIHGFSVLVVMGAIFIAMITKRFEYQYVWQHVSEDLPFRYIFSAFWEGQEGSFLLWMFWHVVLGGMLLWRAKEWEAPTLSVLSFIQVFILSMILGVYVTGDMKIGSNPLLLLRDTMDIPLFNNADYVQMIQGNGLNPLLQNYWMTIHPPTLFLGFASTAIPFCYAIAGLWTRQHKEWLKPALPWALFSGAILGTGILMGGAWAYEALSFGGYWAWDPVENMSLVPWITLVAGIHTHLIAKNAGYSYRSTYLFYLATFILILYSTFLTRSGILGESSVHAFTEMGLETQLLLFIFTFLGLSAVLMVIRRKEIPSQEKEEPLASKEFWMFIGTLVLLFSAVMITGSTSLPVYNKIMQHFNTEFKGLTITDPVTHYNKYQLWIGIFIGLLSGAAQFLRYKEFNWQRHARKYLKHIAIAGGLASLFTLATSFWIQLGGWQFWLLLFTGFFTVVANVDYLLSFLKGNLKLAGSAFSHVGFGLMIVGIIASGLNKQHISSNPMVQRGFLDEDMLEKNVLLFKGMPMYMSGYRVTYERDTMVGNLRTFKVNYEKLNNEGEVIESFSVEPSALYDNKVVEVKAFNPDTKHYLDKDIFTHIATLPMKEANFEFARKQEDSMRYETIYLTPGKSTLILDTVQTQSGQTSVLETQASLVGINYKPTHPDYKAQLGDYAIGAKIAFQKEDTTFFAEPVLVIRGQLLYTFTAQVNDLSFRVRVTDELIDALQENERKLDFHKHLFKQGDAITVNGLSIKFVGVDKNFQHSELTKEKGFLGVGAMFEVTNPAGEQFTVTPSFFIKESIIYNPKAEISELGLHFVIGKINPESETFEILIAQQQAEDSVPLPVQLSKKSFRTDYIVLEAIVFPGINFFWLGSTLMMVGLGVSMFRRRSEKKKHARDISENHVEVPLLPENIE